MADEVTQAGTEAEGTVTPSEAPTPTTQAPTDAPTDLEPGTTAFQAEVDRRVAQALKTQKEATSKKEAEAQAAKEAKEAAERGEFDKVTALKDQKLKDLQTQLVATNVMHSLTDTARQAGLIDMDDLELIKGSAIAQAVNEDGTIDPARLTSLVDEFKVAKPHKFKGADDPVPNRSRFGGTSTPPAAPGQLPNEPKPHNYYETTGLDKVTEQRAENYKRITSRTQRGNQDPFMQMLAERLKK